MASWKDSKAVKQATATVTPAVNPPKVAAPKVIPPPAEDEVIEEVPSDSEEEAPPTPEPPVKRGPGRPAGYSPKAAKAAKEAAAAAAPPPTEPEETSGDVGSFELLLAQLQARLLIGTQLVVSGTRKP